MIKAIIYGSTGQDGYFLTQTLRENNIEVIGISRSGIENKGNIAEYDFVESSVKKYQPDYLFHFAANSTTQHRALFENHETISTGTLNILEAVRQHSPTTKVFLSGSAMQFKNEGSPIDEYTPFEASSPYAVARIQSAYAGRYYRTKFGIHVYSGYFFNHDSPLRSEQHVNQKIVRAAQRIAAGSNEKLELGNIEVEKEFGFAGDTMEAVWILVNQDVIFEAVIGTGNAFSIKDWVISCFNHVGKNWEQHLVVRADYVPEYKRLVSNPALIKKLGWKPKTDFQQLTHLMMTNK